MKITRRQLRSIIKSSLLSEQYTVKVGDTMYDIARKLGVGIADLLDANQQFNASKLGDWQRGDTPGPGDRVGESNRNPNWIYPGDTLSIPGEGSGEAPEAPEGQPGAGDSTTEGPLGQVATAALGREFVDACTQEKIQMLDNIITYIAEIRDGLASQEGE